MAQHFDFLPSAQEGGTRLDVYLAASMAEASSHPAERDDDDVATDPAAQVPSPPMLSRARLQALIAEGAISINGAPCRPSHRVREGERIQLALPEPKGLAVTAVPMDLQVLYEDAHLLVLNKPAHLVVHPGAGTTEPTLVHGLLAHCRDLSGIGGVLRPGIVHRLDKGTSGVMVVAKNDRSHQSLAEQFAARSIQKGYIALVWGVPKPSSEADAQGDLIDTPYGRHPKARRRMTGDLPFEEGGRRARTRWRLVGEDGTLALLAVTLLTGRTHQIRAHLSEMGHPIVGDALYGHGNPALPEACPTLDHQALHAAYLAFEHPVTGERMRYRAPVPASWQQVAHTLSTTTRRVPCLD